MNKPALRVLQGGKSDPPKAPLRLNLAAALLCRWVIARVRVDPDAVARLREIAARGTVVYAMRFRSLVDYLLVLHVLAREGLPVPEFANDVPVQWLRPVREWLSAYWRRLPRPVPPIEERGLCRRLVAQNRSVLIFLRQRAGGLRWFAQSRGVPPDARTGAACLLEIVQAMRERERPVFVVPLAVMRGKGFRRRESRIATLLYSVQEAPSEAKRLISLLWNREDSQLTLGTPTPLREFIELHRDESDERIARRLTRALQIFLYREERVVLGPTLRPKREVRQLVLQGDDLVAAVRQVAREKGEPEWKVWRTAERYFDEMAANFNSVYFAILEYAFNKIWPRIFQGLEYSGLERVIECMRKGPVVLVPCHRSHFDYLILSYIFHNNYLSPPHIAAGINLSFWPLGPLFRGAGAFFIRRSFDDDLLYKTVFRKYLTYLIREGYTQEFFIEGGRSRTGKILTPKLGMLSAIVNAFIAGVRRDLFLVPVSIHYGRIVEEEAYSRELAGAEKEKESLLGLIRARGVLRQKYGTAYVRFAEPISLNAALGERRERFRKGAGDPRVEEQRRRFIQKLGFRLLREVNNATVAGATSVSATVLLSAPHAAIRFYDFLAAARTLTQYLLDQGVAITASLERNMGSEFRESIHFLESGGLVQVISDVEGLVLHVPPHKRMILDFYKNNTIHFFLLPALVSRALLRGLRGPEMHEDVAWWLDMFRWEFPLPEREELAAQLRGLFDYYRSVGAIQSPEGPVRPDHPLVRATAGILDNFQEAYWIAARGIAELQRPTPRKAVIALLRRRYETSLLLGEARKPEGGGTVTLSNALERFRELGIIAMHDRGRGRDRIVERGPAFDGLPALLRRLAPRRAPGEFGAFDEEIAVPAVRG